MSGVKVLLALLLTLLLGFQGLAAGSVGDENSSTLGRPNLLRNGGFEEGTDYPTGFGNPWVASGKAEIGLETRSEYVFAGQKSLRMSASENSRYNVAQRVQVKPGQVLGLSYYCKVENLQSHDKGFTVRIQSLDASYKTVTHDHLFLDGSKETADWRYYERVFKVRDDTHYISIEMFIWNAKGTAWIDELRLVELSEEHLPKVVRRDPAELAKQTDPNFFNLLNLDYPGLDKVKEAVEKKDFEGASAAYLEYRRNREYPKWFFDWKARPQRTGDEIHEGAELIVKHIIDGHFVGDPIDWDFNPLSPTEPAYTREWTWQKLHRFPGWETLGAAYWQTGNERYAQAFIDQMLDWIANSPVPETVQNSSWRWRTIEAGIRTAGSWMNAYHRFLTSPSMTPAAHAAFVSSFYDHARYLMLVAVNPGHTGNWVAMENNGLGTIAVMFPELKEAPVWLKTASERIYRELDAQVYPDGVQIELSSGYHQVSLSNFINLLRLCKLNNIALQEDFLARIEKMYDFNLYFSKPNGTLPLVNDTGSVNVRGSMQQAYEFFGREDFLYVATSSRQGKPPAVDSYFFPYAGYQVMRTGWDRRAHYFLFDVGPCGGWHGHDDKLAIILDGYGVPLLVETGSYNYDQSVWRAHALSTAGHNTILINGLGQNRRHLGTEQPPFKKEDAVWISNPLFDYGSGRYDEGYGERNQFAAVHNREVIFVKPNYWLVKDVVTGPEGRHQIESLYHFRADELEADYEKGIFKTNLQYSPNLLLQKVDTNTPLKYEVAKGKENPMRGWIAGSHQPIPTVIVKQEGAFPLTQTMLLHPFPEQVQPVEAKPLQPVGVKGWDGWAVAVKSPASDDLVVVQPKLQELKFDNHMTTVAARIFVERDFTDRQYWAVEGWKKLENGYFAVEAKNGTGSQLNIIRSGSSHYLLSNPGSEVAQISLQLKEAADNLCAYYLDSEFSRTDSAVTLEGQQIAITLAPGQMLEVTADKGAKLPITRLMPEDRYEQEIEIAPYASLPYHNVLRTWELKEVLKIQGEDFSEERGGKVTIVSDKIGAEGKAFKDWDPYGHTLSWDFEVKEAGLYAFSFRYCAETPAVRQLLIDGEIPFHEADEILFPSTGGWSNTRDDWVTYVFGDGKGTAYLFNLSAGKHRLTMRNLSGSGLNIDFFTVLKAEPVK